MPLAAGGMPLISWVMAGLDERWGWHPGVGFSGQITAVGLTVLGYGIVVWAMGANPFFSTVVRIQQERGHKL